MILRIWHGRTTPENAAAYEELVVEENYDTIAEETGEGYRGFELARREDGDEVEYVTVTRFDSWDAVDSFAGDDRDRDEAYVPPAARELLVDYDETVEHYELVDGETV